MNQRLVAVPGTEIASLQGPSFVRNGPALSIRSREHASFPRSLHATFYLRNTKKKTNKNAPKNNWVFFSRTVRAIVLFLVVKTKYRNYIDRFVVLDICFVQALFCASNVTIFNYRIFR